MSPYKKCQNLKRAGATILGMAVCSRLFAASFTAINLPNGPWIEMDVMGVSADGNSVVGGARGVGPAGFLWRKGFDVKTIPVRYVTGISTDGSTIFGEANPFAFRLRNGGLIQPLGNLSHNSFDASTAFASTSDGSTIVGDSNTANGRRAFRWTEASGMVELTTPGTSNPFYPPASAANAIVADGSYVYGFSTRVGSNYEHAARWDSSSAVQFLTELPNTIYSSGVNAATPSGSLVVGISDIGNAQGGYYRKPCVWLDPNHPVQLPLIDGNWGETVSVSADGSLILGYESMGESIQKQGLIWQQTATQFQVFKFDDWVHNLGVSAPGWQLNAPAGISFNNQTVVGSGINPQGVRQGWIIHVPEPATAALSLCASWIVMGSRTMRCRKRRNRETANKN